MIREPILISAVRSFCKSFSAVIGILVAFVLLFIAIAIFSRPSTVADKTALIITYDADGNRAPALTSSPVILKIKIEGVIGSKEVNAKLIQTQLLDSHTGVLKHNRIKAILLYINSPGGGALDSYNIYHYLIDYKKKYQVPIYAFVDGLCASGGMMIACAADKISSGPVGVIGSVGVRMGPKFNVTELMQKLGVTQKTFTRGKDKDMLNPFRPWETGEDQSIEALLSYDYNLFVKIVTDSRPRMDREKLVKEYGAQVFDPVKAEQLGYIDNGNSSYEKTMKELAQKAGIEKSYQVVELKVLRPILSQLVEGKSPLFSGVVSHEISSPLSHLPVQPLYLYSPSAIEKK